MLQRSLLALGGLSCSGVPGAWARAVEAIGSQDSPKVLVSIFLRGGMDGLMALPPLEDPHLPSARPSLWIPPPRRNRDEEALVDLDNGFGLHPAMSDLLPLWRSGDLVMVHGAGLSNPIRSHFDAQYYMESGTPERKGTPSGWMNRAFPEGGARGAFAAVALTGSMPQSLAGPRDALVLGSLSDFGFRIPLGAMAGQGFESLYRATTSEMLRDVGERSFEADRIAASLSEKSYTPENGAEYTLAPIDRDLQNAATILKANLGTRMFFVESGGWDTHFRQRARYGAFHEAALALSSSLRAFWTDLGDRRENIVVVVMTEFGRTVAENGSGGTDHGRGSCFFVLGTDVVGGRLLGEVPLLAEENREDGRDLPVAVDYRSVLSPVLSHHFGIDPAHAVFPGWTGADLPLFGKG